MQPMWLCIRSGRQFEDTFENPHRGKVKQITNATNVILYARKQAIWEDIWKHTMGENQTIAASATMLLHAIWRNIWKGIVQVPCRNLKNRMLNVFWVRLFGFIGNVANIQFLLVLITLTIIVLKPFKSGCIFSLQFYHEHM